MVNHSLFKYDISLTMYLHYNTIYRIASSEIITKPAKNRKKR
jgi:hypothetical protein